MTTQQLILISCLYLAELVIVTYFTRATPRRIAGALAGGATVGLFGLGAIVLGNAFEFWRVPIFWTPSFLPLFYLGFVISGYPNLPRYLAGGSAIRRARTGGVYRCRGDHRPAAGLPNRGEVPGLDGLCTGRCTYPRRRRNLCRHCGHRARRDAPRRRPFK